MSSIPCFQRRTEIDVDKDFGGVKVEPDDPVRLFGEAEYDGKELILEVDRLEVVDRPGLIGDIAIYTYGRSIGFSVEGIIGQLSFRLYAPVEPC
jgi:hypothetical protein